MAPGRISFLSLSLGAMLIPISTTKVGTLPTIEHGWIEMVSLESCSVGQANNPSVSPRKVMIFGQWQYKLTSHAHPCYHWIHAHVAHVAHAHATSHLGHHIVHTPSATTHSAHVPTSHRVVHHSSPIEATIVVVVVHPHIALESTIIVVIVPAAAHGTGEIAIVLVMTTTMRIVTATIDTTSSPTTIALIVRAIVVLGVCRWVKCRRPASSRPLISGPRGSVLWKCLEWVLHGVGKDNVVLTIGLIGAPCLFNLVFCCCGRLRRRELDVGLPGKVLAWWFET